MTTNGTAITVNGEARSLATGVLEDQLRAEGLELDAKGFAVALNGAVVPRRAWSQTRLAAGDRVEIVGMYKGG